MFYSTPCVNCNVIQELESSRDVCAIVNYEGRNSFMKVLGSNTHGPSNPTEISIHCTLSHKNILGIKALKTWDCSKISNGLGLLVEAADDCLIDWVRNKDIPFEKRLNYAFQCVCSVYELHKNRYLHLDIKPDNFVIINDIVKLTDFGFSRKSVDEKLRVRINHETIKHPYITSVYRAPEAWVTENEVVYTDKMDIFSLGLTLLAVLVSRQIYPVNINVFDDKQVGDFITNTIKEETFFRNMITGFFLVKNIGDRFNPLRDLIIRMLSYNPENRPSIEEVMKNPVWTDWQKPESAVVKKITPFVLTQKVLVTDIRQDVLYIINFYVNLLGDLPSSCMFLSVDLYYRCLSMINANTNQTIFTQRKYLSAVCTWLGILCNYTEDSKYYDLIVSTFPVSNKLMLDGVISEVIIYLGGVLQPDSYFDVAKNADELRVFVQEYLKQPERYVTMNFTITDQMKTNRHKFLSVKELNW